MGHLGTPREPYPSSGLAHTHWSFLFLRCIDNFWRSGLFVQPPWAVSEFATVPASLVSILSLRFLYLVELAPEF